MAAFFILMNYDEEFYRGMRRERIFRDRNNPLDRYDDQEMFKRYRFDRGGCMHLISKLEPLISRSTERNHAVSASLQTFIALKYFATGCVLETTATLHGVDKSTASRCIHGVAEALFSFRNEVIRFPSTLAEVRTAQVNFARISGFPMVVGVVDGTHVRLNGAPLGNSEYQYVNRKGVHSINVQLICDHSYKIIDAVARWPGCTHDSSILQTSIVGEYLDNGRLRGMLLGDSGYGLKPWIMTPILDPKTRPEKKFNNALCRTRVLIEQVNGQLKQKFRCLLHGMQLRPDRAATVIIACTMLHNISKDLRQPEVEVMEEENEHMEWETQDELEELQANGSGIAMREELIQNYFTV